MAIKVLTMGFNERANVEDEVFHLLTWLLGLKNVTEARLSSYESSMLQAYHLWKWKRSFRFRDIRHYPQYYVQNINIDHLEASDWKDPVQWPHLKFNFRGISEVGFVI